MARLAFALVLALVASGCVHARAGLSAPDSEPRSDATSRPEPVGVRIADRALGYIGNSGELSRQDCSGLVETVFEDLGLRLPVADDVTGNAVTREYVALRREKALHRHHPRPGDLAFFHDTYDRNRNGRLDDPLTHVAIVARVADDDTLTLVHYGSHGVATFHMNLIEPSTHRNAQGRELNDNLRIRRRGDPKRTRYLASELFVAFGRPPERRLNLASR